MLIIIGFMCGWGSHLFSDMLTTDGVRLLCWSKKSTIKIVPKKICNLRFSTGGEWEKFNYKSMRAINIMLSLVCFMYPLIDVLLYTKH